MSVARCRLLLGTALAGLVLPGAATAHVTVTPQRLAPGAEGLLVFSVPNERDHVPIVVLTITLPPGFLVGSVETKPGWVATAEMRTVSWRGGRIPPRQFAQFSLRCVAPDRNGPFTITASERFADGRMSSFHPRLTVKQPIASSAEPSRDSGARTLGKFALGAALAGILLATAVGFLALRNWLSLPGPDGETGDFAPAKPQAGGSSSRPP